MHFRLTAFVLLISTLLGVFGEYRVLNTTGTGPTTRYQHMSVLTNDGRMFVHGGVVGATASTGTNSATTFFLDLATLTWSAGTSGPTTLVAGSAVLVGDTVYIWCGGKPSGRSNAFTTYNLTNDTWSIAPVVNGTAPGGATGGRTFGSVAVSPYGTLVVFGGSQGGAGTYFNDLHEYNIETQSWAALPNVNPPPIRSGHSATVYKGKMYIFGGRSGTTVAYNDLWSYDFTTQTWAQLDQTGAIPANRTSFSQVLLPTGELIIFGGGSAGQASQFADTYHLNLNTLTWYIANITNPIARTYHTAVATPSGAIYAFGGGNNQATFGDVLQYDYVPVVPVVSNPTTVATNPPTTDATLDSSAAPTPDTATTDAKSGGNALVLGLLAFGLLCMV